MEPLGATVGEGSTRFVVTSSVAERVELCLFGATGAEQDRVELVCRDGAWSVDVGGVGDGQRYGYRVHGPGDPANGHACDPAKLLVDPATRRVTGTLTWAPELTAPGVDSASFVPRSVVVAPLGGAARLADPVPWDRTFVYEAHVGHLTARHPLVAAEHRGRYGGLAAPAVLDHLRRLGVTAVELLPVQQFVSEAALATVGLRNVWGYNPLAWGAPHEGYASAGGDPVTELREAVRLVHEAGLEVWLDVVFNHTCESSLGVGPILSWRGFDNASTYRLRSGPLGLIDDDLTGCGNAVDTRSASVRRLITELLVRWVAEFGIDGFRFDLAATLIRGDHGPEHDHPFLTDLAAEPALDGVKLVAEPWDVGEGGYAVGRFPAPWREWNDRFRDDTRSRWCGGSVSWSTTATRITGSADLFCSDALAPDPRHPSAGINAVATHDGLTLADLAAGPAVEAHMARRIQRALLGSVLFAQGVPMLSSGDELGRSQGGSHDGYTIEPEVGGVDWNRADWDLVAWTAAASALRSRASALAGDAWIEPGDHTITWLTAEGLEQDTASWDDAEQPALQVLVAEDPVAATPRTVVVLVPRPGPVEVTLPGGTWWIEIDAQWARGAREPRSIAPAGPRVAIEGPTLVVFADRR